MPLPSECLHQPLRPHKRPTCTQPVTRHPKTIALKLIALQHNTHTHTQHQRNTPARNTLVCGSRFVTRSSCLRLCQAVLVQRVDRRAEGTLKPATTRLLLLPATTWLLRAALARAAVKRPLVVRLGWKSSSSSSSSAERAPTWSCRGMRWVCSAAAAADSACPCCGAVLLSRGP